MASKATKRTRVQKDAPVEQWPTPEQIALDAAARETERLERIVLDTTENFVLAWIAHPRDVERIGGIHEALIRNALALKHHRLTSIAMTRMSIDNQIAMQAAEAMTKTASAMADGAGVSARLRQAASRLRASKSRKGRKQ